MTTIVFKETKSGVEIAYDSKVSNGYSHDELEQPKVFKVGQVYVGVAGLVSFANHVAEMHLPNHKEGMDARETDRWVHSVFIPALRRAGSMVGPEGGFEINGQVLVAVNKRVYEIGSDYSRVRITSGNYSIGSGSPYAKSALNAGASAKRSVEIAAQSDLFTGHTIKTLTC